MDNQKPNTIKIAVITTTWSNNNFHDMLSGINEAISEKNVVVDIYNAYDISSSKLRSHNELTVHVLPLPELYDALLIFKNSEVGDDQLFNVIDLYKKAGKPVIAVDRKFHNIPFVGIDNYASEYSMVEHMITEHNCKTFQFVGGVEFYYDNVERFRAFKDCLKNYNLKLDERYVSFYSFLEQDGMDAFNNTFNNLPMPDAVICANDKMAVGYCLEAQKKNLFPPNDFKICGFDNIDEAENYFPSITSVNKNIAKLVKTAIDLVLDFINGKTCKIPESTLVPGYVKINESCGCNSNKDLKEHIRFLITDANIEKYADQKARELRMLFCACKTFEELQKAVKISIEKLGFFYEVAFCIKNEIYKSIGEISSECSSKIMHCYTPENVSQISPLISTKPEDWFNRKEKVFIYSSIYFDTEILGYAIIPDKPNIYKKKYHEYFIDSISIAIENIRQKILIDNMNYKFKELYIKDQMTELYNRFGFSSLSEKLFTKYNGIVYIVFIDVDNLKAINDTYGHAIGDLVITGTAECIKRVFYDTSLCVRMGGDEFLIMGEYKDEKLLIDRENEFTKALSEFSTNHELPVQLQASIGHCFNVKETKYSALQKMMKIADDKMYIVKQKRKAESQSKS